MSEPGDLVDMADYAFAWRALEPRPDTPHALVVLLHGVGGDETQLAALGARVPAGTLVALPRGHRSISGDRLGWYRVGLSEDGLQVVQDEADEARCRLADFVAQLRSRHDVPASRTLLAGFSQGGMLAAASALATPADIGGFAMIAGALVPEITRSSAAREDLDGMHALLVHGRDDETLPADGALQARDELDALGLATELRLHEGGHEVTPAMADDVTRWLVDILGE